MGDEPVDDLYEGYLTTHPGQEISCDDHEDTAHLVELGSSRPSRI